MTVDFHFNIVYNMYEEFYVVYIRQGDIMKIYISAFAEKQKEIERMLSDKTEMVITHILYIIMAPQSETVNHWCQEIFSFISKVDLLKGKNRYPSAKNIYSWTYGKKQDTITHDVARVKIKIRNAISKEHFKGEYDANTIADKLDNACEKYFSWLADQLSRYGEVASDDVEEVLKKLVNES